MMGSAGSPSTGNLQARLRRQRRALLFPGAECGAVDETPHLSELERDCLGRYLSVLQDKLGDELVAVWLFGSAARGDAWWSGMPIRSDVDLLVVA